MTSEVTEARPIRPQRLPAIFGVLSLALQSIQGDIVTVELQNDSEVTGILEEVDSNMNMILCDAQQVMLNGVMRQMEIISINGTNVRYVHFSPSVNIQTSTANYVKNFKRNTSKKGQIFDRKKKRSFPSATEGEDKDFNSNEVVLESKAKW